MWKFCDLPWHERRINTLPHINKFFSSSFLSLCQPLKCLSTCVASHNFTMKFPTDLHDYTEWNELLNSFSWFTFSPPNKLSLSFKPHLSVKRGKKATSCKKWLLRGVLEKRSPKNFSKFTVKYQCGSLFLTLLKVFSLSGL